MQNRNSRLTPIFNLILCLSVLLSSCLGLTAIQLQQKTDVLVPTAQDERLEAWYTQHGILGTDRVQVRTTPRSVAGRGLFYSATKPAQKGDLLAFIPARCILTKKTAEHAWPDLKLALQEDTPGRDDWPVLLTAYAHRALSSDVAWSEWIQTWQGPPAPSPPDSLTKHELQELAMQTQSSANEIKKALQVRYNVFQNHCRRLEASYGCTHDVDDLYSVVLSRAASLGPDWKYESGIIPLHDMLNHPSPDKLPNVELFSIGEVASHTSLAHVASLAKSTFSKTNVEDRDLVLVARQTIHPGEELLLSYTKRDLLSGDQAAARVWKTLQYGFCLW